MNELEQAAFAGEPAEGGSSRRTRFIAFRRRFDRRAYLAALTGHGYRFVGRSDPAFPPLLAAIHDPPPGLFVRGANALELLSEPAVAIVGARACSAYGTAVAHSLARALAEAGVTVVSGLARGVDAAAHRGALDGGGLTVAVLGCGIDRDYPRAHAQLAARVAESGAIVSEYPPGVEPAPWRFPARNRIVAGLTRAAIVVEARVRSGALITADFALEEGREVLAVPGEITSALSEGANALLRLGATPVTCVGDVLEAIGLERTTEPADAPPDDPCARAVLDAIAAGAAGVDEAARATGLDAGVVAATLVELELAGLVSEADGLYRGVMRRA